MDRDVATIYGFGRACCTPASFRILRHLSLLDPRIDGLSPAALGEICGVAPDKIKGVLRRMRATDLVIGVLDRSKIYYRVTSKGKLTYNLLCEIIKFVNEDADVESDAAPVPQDPEHN